MPVRPTKDYTRYFVAIWWCVHVLRYLYFDHNVESMDSVSSGDLFNQLESLGIGFVSLFHMRDAIRRIKAARGVWLTFLSLYLVWSFTTVVWSEDPALTLRRYSLFIVQLVGWIGLGAGYYGGDSGPAKLCRHMRWAGFILIVFALPIIGPELTPTNLLNPQWESYIRQLGPDAVEVGVFALVACLAPQSLDDRINRQKVKLFGSSALIMLMFLLVTKGRAPIAMALIVFGFTGLRALQNRMLQNVLRTCLILLLALMITSTSTDWIQSTQVGQFLSRGNDTHALEGLNGRTDLWAYVGVDIDEHPLQGAGFGAYWQASRMGAVLRRFHWHAPLAHNGYLDETVQNGLVGLVLILLFLFAIIFKLWRVRRVKPEALIGISWIILFLLLNFTDSYFQNFRRPGIIASMLMAFATITLTSRNKHTYQAQQPQPYSQPYLRESPYNYV